MMRGILQLAGRYRMPVTVHLEYTRQPQFSALLQAFPGVSVVWAHGGYTHAFVAQRMLERHPNLLYELSARTLPIHPRSQDYTMMRRDGSVIPQWLDVIAHP